MKNAVLPVTNPTGNPFPHPLKLPSNNELKGLQVKLVLEKLSDPPRSYADKIKMEDNDMQVDRAQGKSSNGNLTLAERFGKI